MQLRYSLNVSRFFFPTKEKNEGAADVAVVAIVNEENTKKDVEKMK